MNIHDWPFASGFVPMRDRELPGLVGEPIFPEALLPPGVLELRGEEVETWAREYRRTPGVGFRKGFLDVFYTLELLAEEDEIAKALFAIYERSFLYTLPEDYACWLFRRKPEVVRTLRAVFDKLPSGLKSHG